MAINFNTPVLTRKNEPMMEGTTAINLGYVALFGIDNSKANDGPEKYRRFRLGVEIQAAMDENKPLTIKKDELDLLDKLVAEIMPPHIYGQFHDAMENEKGLLK